MTAIDNLLEIKPMVIDISQHGSTVNSTNDNIAHHDSINLNNLNELINNIHNLDIETDAKQDLAASINKCFGANITIEDPIKEQKIEPFLVKNNQRYVMFPIEHKDIYNLYETHEKTIWLANDIDISQDLPDWYKLDNGSKKLIKQILAFFAASDGIIMENISANFASEIQSSEARLYYAVQNYMEGVHGLVYSKLIETYIKDDDEKDRLFRAIETMPEISAKAKWAEKWITRRYNFATRLLAFAIVEGLFFSSAFAFIYYIAEKRIMPALCMSNEFIARDEGLHVNFAAHLYKNHIVNKLTQEEVNNLIYEAVEIEKEFVRKTIAEPLLGMNADMMIQYVEYVANRLMNQFGYITKFADVKCPFPFMDKIGLQNQTSFFDTRVSDYQRNNTVAKKNAELKFDVDF